MTTKKLIAPHEGRELHMVMQGEKNICTIQKSKDPVQLQIAKNTVQAAVSAAAPYGRGNANDLMMEQIDPDTFAFYLRKNSDVAAVHRLLLESPDKLVRTNKERSVLFGRIFGYSEEEIEAFLEADMQCACGHCKIGG